jgi:hypothetical protein
MFVNKAHRKIFGSKWDEVVWNRRILHNSVLDDLCMSPGVVRKVNPGIYEYLGTLLG